MTDCVSCGADLNTNYDIQPHCLNDECNIGYAKWFYGQNIVPVGDCLNWQGRLRKGCPVIKVSTMQAPYRRSTEYPARAVGFLIEGTEIVPHRKYQSLCKNALCVASAHHKYSDWRPPQLAGHLDPEPLYKFVAIKRRLDIDHEDPMPELMRQVMNSARKRGWITVRKVDEICCDWLGMHPADIYGDEFYTA